MKRIRKDWKNFEISKKRILLDESGRESASNASGFWESYQIQPKSYAHPYILHIYFKKPIFNVPVELS